MDASYFYFDDYKVKADTTTKYKMARAGASPTPAPTVTPVPTPSTTASLDPLSKFFEIFDGIKTKLNVLVAKISIQASTALGETLAPQRPRKMDFVDLKIQQDLMNRLQAKGDDTIQSTAQNPSDDNTTPVATTQYFGLKYYVHPYTTSNCSQIKDCKVTSTHIEFNTITTTSGQSSQAHWVYEISNQVPGLFVRRDHE